MSKNRDILIDDTGDIVIGNKDIAVGDSTLQNQYVILLAQKGEFKEFPHLGAGIGDIANDDDVTFWKHKIREELKRDGMKIKEISIKNENLYINAEY